MRNSLRNSKIYEARFGFKERDSTFCFYFVLLVALLCFIGLLTYFTKCYYGVVVSGNSMRNTLYSGENLLMRYTDKNYKADYGDIIIVKVDQYSEFDGTGTQFLIKRLIAKEGDTVRCKDGVIEILYSGEIRWTTLDEPYAYYSNNKMYYDFSEYQVGEGEIFFLGDNRFNSSDSRYKDSGSRLSDRLYKEKDIYGVIPDWVIRNQKILNVLFFRNSVEMGNE